MSLDAEKVLGTATAHVPNTEEILRLRAPRVYAAIANVMADIGASGIAKDRKNSQGWMYRGIDDVMNAASGPMSSRGLVPAPRVLFRQQLERRSKDDKPLFWTFLELEVTFFSVEDGSSVVVSAFGEAMDNGDKSTGKAFSYAYRDALVKTFCIPVDGTGSDADATTHEVAPKVLLVQPRHEGSARQTLEANKTTRESVPAASGAVADDSGPRTDAQGARIRELIGGKGITMDAAQRLAIEKTGVDRAMTEAQADVFIAALEVFGS